MRRLSAVIGMISMICTLVAAGCSGFAEDGGDMNPPQESISDGNQNLSAAIRVKVLAGFGVKGLTAAEVADGWTVEYTRFLVTLGAFEFTRADGSAIRFDEMSVVDLQAASGALDVAEVALPAGVSAISFTMPVATSEFLPIKPTSPIDRGFMVDNGYSIYVEGTISRKDGLTCDAGEPQVCTPAPVVAFSWGLDVGAVIEDCPELELAVDEVATRTLTLAGDRWLHTNFQTAVGATPVRRAQWIADADRDRDGMVTLDELARTPASSLFNKKLGYDVRGGAPVPVMTGRDFVVGQAQMIAREALGCGSSSSL